MALCLGIDLKSAFKLKIYQSICTFRFEPAVQVFNIHVTQLEPVKENPFVEKPVLDWLKPCEHTKLQIQTVHT